MFVIASHAQTLNGFWEEKSKREWLSDVEGKDYVDRRSSLDGRFIHRLLRVMGLATAGFKWNLLVSKNVALATLFR